MSLGSRPRFAVCPLLALIVFGLPIAEAAGDPIVWTGPAFTFSKLGSADPTQAANQDRITDNVWITRGGGSSGGIYNAKVESFFNKALNNGPLGTEWATAINNPDDGISADNHVALDFTTWAESFGGPGFDLINNIFSPAVLHLIDDDIFLDIQFTAFNSTGLVTYQRSTPAPPPTGDYNGDHVVDAADYTVWRDTFGHTVDNLGDGADGNSSGVIDLGDYQHWKDRFGNIVPMDAAAAPLAVPEPPTLAWLTACSLTIASYRKHSPRGPGQEG